jgi:hypothetical protein
MGIELALGLQRPVKAININTGVRESLSRKCGYARNIAHLDRACHVGLV